MGLWPFAYVILISVFPPTQQIRKLATIETTGVGSFTLANEYGIIVSNRNSAVLRVKACSDAVVVVSDIASITNDKGHYFLVMIGNKDNTETQVMDSCFTCPRTKVVKGAFLDCNKFITFWMQWDGEGEFKLGKGEIVGRELHVQMQGKLNTYMANFIQLTSTNKQKAIFKFSIDTPLKFLSPAPDGSTVISLNETEAVNMTLLEVKLVPKSPEVVLSVQGEGAEDFFIDNRTLCLRNPLDFETRQYYTLAIGSNEGFAVAMTVSVRDENDETPSLTVFSVNIPEEIPEGTVIGGFYNVFDRDREDNLTFSLSGKGSDLFMAMGRGYLKLIKRLDRDGPDGILTFDNLTLTVTDLVGHTTSAILNITVLDINDNTPVCDPTYLEQNITEASEQDVVISNLTSICQDLDAGDNGNLTFKILGEEWMTSVFSVHKGALIARAGGLDRENSTQGSSVVFFVQAMDSAHSEARRKTYIKVKVKVLPLNEFAPEWQSLKSGHKDGFHQISIVSDTPVGTVITILYATDRDKGDNPLVYRITSIKTGSGRDASDVLQIDSTSGHLSVKKPLTGLKSLLVDAQVSDGNNTIKTKLSIKVLPRVTSNSSQSSSPASTAKPNPNTANASTEPSHEEAPVHISHQNPSSHTLFDKRLFYIPTPSSADVGRSILNFTLQVLSSTQAVIIDMPAGKYFSLKKDHSWQLMYTSKPFSKKAIPTVIPILVKDRVTKTTVDEAYVVFKPEKCGEVPKTPRHNEFSVKPAMNRHHGAGSVHVQNPVPTKHAEGCRPSMSQTTKILSGVSAVESVVLGVVLVVFLYKKFTSQKKQSSVVPQRKDPLGCDEGEDPKTIE